MPPGYHPEFHLGVISAESKILVAFISATPADIRVYSTTIPMAEINFLCIHKKLRSKRFIILPLLQIL
jgi:glycylpeptide N-tetradecanoyltransferase